MNSNKPVMSDFVYWRAKAAYPDPDKLTKHKEICGKYYIKAKKDRKLIMGICSRCGEVMESYGKGAWERSMGKDQKNE